MTFNLENLRCTETVVEDTDNDMEKIFKRLEN